MKRKLITFYIAGITLLMGCQKNNEIHPQQKNIIDAVFASGSIISNNQYYVTSMSEGYLVNSYVKEGDTVTEGKVLFQIYDDVQRAQLESAEASYQYALSNSGPNSALLQQLNIQYIQLQNKFISDSLNYIRYNNLISSNAVSQTDFEKVKLAYENSYQELQATRFLINDTKKNLELELIKSKSNLVSQQNSSSYYALNSRVNGIVLQTFKTNGDLVKRGETVAEIGSGDFIVKLFISEDDINSVMVGQEVFVELNTKKDFPYKAKISKVYPAFNSKEQSFIAEAVFVEPVIQLKTGTQLQANIVINQKLQALVIPSNYLLPDDCVMTSHKREKVKVQVGIKTTEWTEIISGIDENTTLVLPN